ncbi:MAG: hypothetical protein Q9225_003390 [Loekoesia sp. 1 TL-2023]
MASDPPGSDWHKCVQGYFRSRASAQKVVSAWQAFGTKYPPLPRATLAKELLDVGCRKDVVDPRLPIYIEALLDVKSLDVSTLLAAVQPSPPDDGTVFESSLLDAGDSAKPSLQTVILQLLTRKIANGIIVEDSELFCFLKHVLSWMTHFPSSVTLGFLVSATLGCPLAQEVLQGAKAKKFKASFGQSLTPFIGNLSQTNIDLATALNYRQKQYQFHDELPADSMDLLNGVDLGALSFQDSVLDNEPLNTRAGLYIYLNAMLCERPLFDDAAVMNYLNMRYKGNVPSLVTDLILASFDILANAMYRTEPAQSITILRSFLVNKLPAFLNNYTAFIFPPLTTETCISQALLRVDPAAFPSFSQMFDLLGKNGMLSEARQEFLFACALHQLIPEGSIEGLLGDVPMQSLPASGRYARSDLVAQCTANPARIEELIAELENMEGNAGEIVGALIELLDNWEEHEDQAENQPVYDEFGSVLLLVSVIQHRFDLDLTDLGVLDRKSFTSKYYRSACESRAVDRLTEHESDLLGAWVRGLFETEGINDELMSMCKPAEFHILVATLFDQSIKACQARVLALDTLTGGFEYLLEPFLLPSLTAGLTWFAHKIWETKDPSPVIDTLIPTLSTLLKPPSMSSDSAAMHSAVLAIVAEPLDEALNHAQRVHKLRVDINPLLEILKQHMQKHRHAAAAYNELENWATTPRLGLQSALSNSIHALILWCLAEGPAGPTGTSSSPPNYTHRLLRSAVMLLGAKATLRVLVDEVVAQTENGSEQDVDIVLDIVVTMIVAPQLSQSSSSQRLTLRDVLQTLFSEVGELSKTDANRARVVVRIHRRVESFFAVGPVNDVGMEGIGEGGGMVLGNAEGMPATDIDDVLKHTEERIERGEFLGGVEVEAFMGMG